MTKIQMTKTKKTKKHRTMMFLFWILNIRISDLFRISNFGFRAFNKMVHPGGLYI
jgi:hypothetical protein